MAKKKIARRKLPATKAAPLAVPDDYPRLLSALKSRIRTARVQAHLAVNRELIRLYWDIGRMIVGCQEVEGWGKAVIERLSTDLCTAFPEMKGLSLSNLWRMRSFFLAYSHLPEILAQAARELDEASQTAEVLAQLARDSDVSPILQQAVAEFEQGSAPEVLIACPPEPRRRREAFYAVLALPPRFPLGAGGIARIRGRKTPEKTRIPQKRPKTPPNKAKSSRVWGCLEYLVTL